MNYLGHLLVLPDAGLLSLGNLLGDFVKGRLDTMPRGDFRAGVQLHRELDRYTDAHPAVKRSRARIDEKRRRISGVLVDVFYDHFLAGGNDWDRLFAGLAPHVADLPPGLQDLPARMVSSRWLGAYARIDGIGAVLVRMDQRRARPLGLGGSEQELLLHYDAFQRDQAEFFPDVQGFVRRELPRILEQHR